uniref:Uncharacterized protein n=1 Tax=Trypanosoma congolense (strain IL3000) TaxID=1068625 RepID=G0UQL2_TRYCI|nr:conserved hypothetical protein [Trypanosoma congolense IL3000]
MNPWSKGQPNGPRPAAVSSEATPVALCEAVRNVEENMEGLKRRLAQAERNIERQRIAINEMWTNTSPFEDLITKTNGDIQSIQQQLEYVVISLERERGVITDHTEQLRLFARESIRRDGYDPGFSGTDTSYLFVVATWLYRPLVDFANGCYVLLSPIINTLQSLSLFNSDVVARQEKSGVCLNNKEPEEDLLVRLQKGLLDPTPTPTKM